MRQITFYKFECGKQELKERPDGLFEMVRTPITTVEETSLTKAGCRAAIREAGVECKRGEDVYFTKVGRVRYKFETADLMAVAKEREELPLTDPEE